MAAEVRVPGMGVHDVRARGPGGHLQIDAHRAEGGVGTVEARRFGVGGDAGFVAGGTETVHPDVGEPAQVAGQVLDVHPGATVDLRRVLAGQDIDADLPTER